MILPTDKYDLQLSEYLRQNQLTHINGNRKKQDFCRLITSKRFGFLMIN